MLGWNRALSVVGGTQCYGGLDMLNVVKILDCQKGGWVRIREVVLKGSDQEWRSTRLSQRFLMLQGLSSWNVATVRPNDKR